MKYKIIGFILIFLIIGGVLFYFQRLNYYKRTRGESPLPTPSVTVSPPVSQSPSATPVASRTPTPTPGTSPTPSASPSVSPRPEKTLKVEVTQDAAGLYESRTKKGTLVHFTISVTSDSVALEFKSGDITTGSIAPGSSKTLDFTIEKSMTFTPYVASTGKAGPYTIKIIVAD